MASKTKKPSFFNTLIDKAGSASNLLQAQTDSLGQQLEETKKIVVGYAGVHLLFTAITAIAAVAILVKLSKRK